MTSRFEKQVFEGFHDPEEIRTYSDLELIKCKFYGGGFGHRHTPDFSRRTTAERVILKDCEARKFCVGPALVRDILIENLRSDVIRSTGLSLSMSRSRDAAANGLSTGRFSALILRTLAWRSIRNFVQSSTQASIGQ